MFVNNCEAIKINTHYYYLGDRDIILHDLVSLFSNLSLPVPVCGSSELQTPPVTTERLPTWLPKEL